MLGETALQTLLFVFEGVGVVAFALSGALAAVRKRLDVVGVVVCVVAIVACKGQYSRGRPSEFVPSVAFN